jgi:outer membrane receptor for ferric coprogen and ferric-rhodotorulic acid
MLCITTTPGSAVQSNGSTVCMIGGSGRVPSKMARTKSRPGIEAITSGGVTPYWILRAGWSGMQNIPGYDDGHHTKPRRCLQPA